VNALWSGFLSVTKRLTFSLEDYCCCVEAVEEGEHAAAEFADISGEAYCMLGMDGGDTAATKLQASFRGKADRKRVKARKETKSDPRKNAAASKMQRLVRGWIVRRNATGADAFFGSVMAVRAKCVAWTRVFEEVLKGQEGGKKELEEKNFGVALLQLQPQLSAKQVDALLVGIREGLGKQEVDCKTFCSVVQAVAAGTNRAAEFADIAEDDFIALGKQAS
jgi:hypothetical protein